MHKVGWYLKKFEDISGRNYTSLKVITYERGSNLAYGPSGILLFHLSVALNSPGFIINGITFFIFILNSRINFFRCLFHGVCFLLLSLQRSISTSSFFNLMIK